MHKLLYSTFLKPICLMGVGVNYAIMIAGAPELAKVLALEMSLVKWLALGLWYLLVSLSLAAGFTLIGEREPGAGPKFLAATLIPLAIIGVLLLLFVL